MNQREHAVDRCSRIFTVLKAAAEANDPCPTNNQLADRFQCAPAAIIKALHFLEANGMIEVERMNTRRIVTICASGARTAGEPGKPHWRERSAA